MYKVWENTVLNRRINMRYFEILYKNCIGKKYVGLCYGKDKHHLENVVTNGFNGIRILVITETNYENYRKNRIVHFTAYGFSVN